MILSILLIGLNNSLFAQKISQSESELKSLLCQHWENQKDLILTKWYFKPEDIVQNGDIICDIGNENITMEVETVYSGKILSICKLNEELTSETELFKIEGI